MDHSEPDMNEICQYSGRDRQRAVNLSPYRKQNSYPGFSPDDFLLPSWMPGGQIASVGRGRKTVSPALLRQVSL